MQRLLGELRKADQAYGLIQPGDKIMIGVSGGKDSLALCALLSAYRRFCPAPFSLEAVCLKIGEPFDTAPLSAFMESLHIPFTVVEEDFLPLLEKEKSPCSLCARLRRGILLKQAEAMGCNKLALGINKLQFQGITVFKGLSIGNAGLIVLIIFLNFTCFNCFISCIRSF